MSSAPPGLGVTGRTGYGSGYAAGIGGTPGADPPYDPAHVYPAVVHLFDCNPVWADLHAADATLTDLQSAVTAGDCYHHVQLPVTITIVNHRPTVAPTARTSLLNSPVSYQIPASDPDGQTLTYTVTNLPAGLSASPSGLVTGTPWSVDQRIVTVTVADPVGASDTKTFAWTVIDNHPPVCTGASASPSLLWAPNHTLVPFSILGVTDEDHDPLAFTITRITQDQPLNSTGDGNTLPDATGVGTSTAAVRAERTGNLRVPDEGRLYQIDFTTSDGKPGGTCAGTVFIGVPHDQRQHTLPSDNQCRWDSVTGAQLGPCASLAVPAVLPNKKRQS